MIIQKTFNPYPKNMLPINFQYPENYIALSKSTDSINYHEKYHFQWWFEDYGTDGAELSFQLRNKKIPNMNLIPFAQNGDWKAYFDGDDISATPKVIVIDLTDLSSYMVCKNFEEWLFLAIQDMWRF